MNHILLLTSFIVSCFSFGQLVESRILKEQPLKKMVKSSLIGQHNNRLLALSEHQKNLNIDIYDADSLNLLYREQINLPDHVKGRLYIEGIYRVKDQWRLVAAGHTPGKNQYRVLVYTVLENGKISETYEKMTFDYDVSDAVTIFFDAKTNPDNSLLFIHLTMHDLTITNHLMVYDTNPNKIFQLDYKPIPFMRKINKKAVSYYAGKEHLYELYTEVIYNRSIRKYQAKMELKKYDLNAREVSSQTFDLEDGVVLTDIHIREHGNNVRLTGSYLTGSKKEFTGIGGLYTAVLNSDLSVKQIKNHAFSQDTKLKSLGSSKYKDASGVSADFKLHSCLTDDQGNDYLLYERVFIKGYPLIDGFRDRDYYFESIIALKINEQGIVDWETFIPKFQYLKESRAPFLTVTPNLGLGDTLATRFSRDSRHYASFKPILKNDELFLIYNNHPESENMAASDQRKILPNMDAAIPLVLHLSPEGNVNYQTLDGLKVGADNQQITHSILDGTTLFTLRDSETMQVLQRIELE